MYRYIVLGSTQHIEFRTTIHDRVTELAIGRPRFQGTGTLGQNKHFHRSDYPELEVHMVDHTQWHPVAPTPEARSLLKEFPCRP